MACDLATIKTAACESGIGRETNKIKLLQLIAQLTCEAAEGAASGGAVWGSITGTLTDQADLVAALNTAAIAARPVTGVVTPVGNVTPTFVGQFYTDTVNANLYQAFGLTSADWTQWI